MSNAATLRAVRIAAIAAVVALSSGASYATEQISSQRGVVTSKARVVSKGHAATYDWFANRRSPEKLQLASYTAAEAVRGRQFGRGSWICSFAGSGRKSQCYAR